MARTSITSRKLKYNSRKVAAARQAVARASAVLRGRTLAPARTGGFYGLYTKRGRDELKVIDSGSTSPGVVPVAGALILINGVATGTDYTARIGRKICLKSMLVRFNLAPNYAASDSTGETIRIMLVWDTQSNSAAPLVTDVLNAADYLSPNNLNNRDRFKILADKFLTLPGWTAAAGALVNGSPVEKNLKLYKKGYWETVFSGTGATVGSIQTGALYILYIGSGGAQTNFSYNSRVRFIDA